MESDPAAGVGVLAALAAGLVSFLSPCVLPLVPGYLSTVTGVAAADLGRADWRRVIAPSLLFVASFSAIFILLGLTATGLGSALQENQRLLEKVAAVVIITMGVFFVAALFVPRLNREWHVEGLLERAGKGGPLVAGAAFAIAWTPCVGPTLAAILSAAALSDSAGRGAFLLAVYSAGLAIPFLLTAVAFTRMTTAFAAVKRHYAAIMAAGGVILIAMGVLIWTNELFRLNNEAQDFLDRFGLNFFSEV
jgi:cytochrome c-type biogenesis protein